MHSPSSRNGGGERLGVAGVPGVQDALVEAPYGVQRAEPGGVAVLEDLVAGGGPVGPVDAGALQGLGQVVQVQVPSGQGLQQVLAGEVQLAGEHQEGPLRQRGQLPAQPAVDVGVQFQQARRVEGGDGAAGDGGVAVDVGVEPAQLELAAHRGLEGGLGQPRRQFGGVGEGLPDP
ncbi:hypothetical protein GCM10023085_43340 [Actinomadura viridis]